MSACSAAFQFSPEPCTTQAFVDLCQGRATRTNGYTHRFWMSPSVLVPWVASTVLLNHDCGFVGLISHLPELCVRRLQLLCVALLIVGAFPQHFQLLSENFKFLSDLIMTPLQESTSYLNVQISWSSCFRCRPVHCRASH